MDCSSSDSSDCEGMKGKASPISATMKAKIAFCGC